ncbi:MAG: hypothetical protein KDA41_05165, partial [Planctomycetales bacterium]|nr:hypothetical protein [Planctomycetales bacterium]
APRDPDVLIARHMPFGQLMWLGVAGQLNDPLTTVWTRLMGPFIELFGTELSLGRFVCLMLGCFVTLLIWAVIGGAISRAAALQLCRDERVGPRASLGFALRKFPAYVAGPLYPLAGVALYAAVVFLFIGLPMNLDIGLVWAGFWWPLVLAVGTAVAVLLLGFAAGWPLMWATISVEGADSFDALSRSYAYALGRPLYYLFYVALAGFVGALAWIVVLLAGEAVIYVSWWAADWGVFDEGRMSAVMAAADGAPLPEAGGAARTGVALFQLGNGMLRTITFSFAYSFFWVSATAVYLLLRREVDHTETDEVFVDEDAEPFGLPPLEDDATATDKPDSDA